MTLSDLSKQLDDLIANDQLQDALKLLKNFSSSASELNISATVQDAITDLIRNTQGQLNGLERDQNLGVLKGEDYRVGMNTIRQTVQRIQDMIDELAQGKTPDILAKSAAAPPSRPQVVAVPTSGTDNFLKFLILGFAGICGIAFIVFLFMGDMLQGAALSFTGVAGSIYGYMRFRIMETTLRFVNSAPEQLDSAALSAALNKNILNVGK